MISECLPLVYFGKLPSRGDFVRARNHLPETNAIDQWVSQAIALSGSILPEPLANDNANKESPFLYFSHVDTVSNQIITGVLLPSQDSSGRHRQYPVIGFGVIHGDNPKNWMKYLPVKSMPLWNDIQQALLVAKQASDSAQMIEQLNACQLTIDNHASTQYYDFINTVSLQQIAVLMDVTKSQLVQQIIATGLLFLPTFSKGFAGLNKIIHWSLPTSKSQAIYLATFWHDLIHGFYQPHQLSLNTYLYQGVERYKLLMSFIKPDGQLLSQLAASEADAVEGYPDDWVAIASSDWTQGYIDNDIGLSRLSQDDLSLYEVRQLFKRTFLAQ